MFVNQKNLTHMAIKKDYVYIQKDGEEIKRIERKSFGFMPKGHGFVERTKEEWEAQFDNVTSGDIAAALAPANPSKPAVVQKNADEPKAKPLGRPRKPRPAPEESHTPVASEATAAPVAAGPVVAKEEDEFQEFDDTDHQDEETETNTQPSDQPAPEDFKVTEKGDEGLAGTGFGVK